MQICEDFDNLTMFILFEFTSSEPQKHKLHSSHLSTNAILFYIHINCVYIYLYALFGHSPVWASMEQLSLLHSENWFCLRLYLRKAFSCSHRNNEDLCFHVISKVKKKRKVTTSVSINMMKIGKKT